MDIKGNKLRYYGLCLILLLLGLNILPTISLGGNLMLKSLQTSSAESTLIDKVYNFTVDKSYQFFNNNLYMEAKYNYYTTVRIVTPHTCDLNITLWDPEGDQFELSSEKNMEQNEYREVPYGTALTGNYSMLFNASLSTNLNIHIRVERGEVCIFDKVSPFDQDKIIYYNVSKFHNGTSLHHNLTLRSDWYYQFYFSRTSAISADLNNTVYVKHYIIDSQGIPFVIYTNRSIAGPNDISSYWFGTATPGQYNVSLTIECEVSAINLVYAILEKEQISSRINPNDPDLEPLPDNSTLPGNYTTPDVQTFIPKEWTVGIIIFTGLMVGIPIIIVVNRKKKNATGI